MICPQCSKEFEPVRHQRFCSPRCKVKSHGDGGLRGIVSSVRKMKRGSVSVVIRFDPLSAHNALQIEPGALIEVIK
jgi:hypothetical protein